MANTTGTYTTGLVDGTLNIDLGRFLIEQGYVTGVASFLSPAYFAPLAEKSGFAFVSGVTTYNLDDIYVRNDYWRQGNLLNWGFNDQGQLAQNNVTDQYSPMQTISGGITWKQASCGYKHTAGVKSDGTLWLWGDNSSGALNGGRLGDNSATDRSSPVQTVSAGTNWWLVSCGFTHTACIKTDGTLWLWGDGNDGGLGDNFQITRSSPVQTVSGGTSWKQVSCGKRFNGAIKSDNTLWVWGSNIKGQLGTNNITFYSSPVQTVSGGTTWKQVSCGGAGPNIGPSDGGHMAAVKTDNTLWLWGYNLQGQLGDNTSTPRSSPVQTVSAGSNWKWVSCGERHTCAIKTDGTLWCWGNNQFGQLGNNSTTPLTSPVQTISATSTWKEVSCGGNTTYAIKTDGTLWAWGYNNKGQGGFALDGTSRSSPVQTLIGGTAWRKASGGYAHALALDYNDQPSSIIVPAPPPSTPSCWVARLVYGENNPDWIVFREWMLNDSPKWFKNTYLKYGERFASFIRNKPMMQYIVRKAMDIIVKK